MKLMHLSDLHLGKRLHERSLLEDQRHMLQTLLAMAETEHPDAVIIAGDVYDKAVPSAEAVELFDDFLVGLAERVNHIFLISGNHDSPERIAFGGRLMDRRGVHVSPVYAGAVVPVTLQDEHGSVDFWLLPFVKPAHVRRYFPDAAIESYTDAIATAIGQMAVDPKRRNVLVTHQFVTGATTSESEEHTVGGTDNVDASVFDGFDYVALGHLHKAQSISRSGIRYCGTPLKYSFAEAAHEKTVTFVTLTGEGLGDIRTEPIIPLRDMRRIRGSYMELTARSFYEGTNREDYLQITLTDEEDVPEAIARLRAIYPNILLLSYDNCRTRAAGETIGDAVPEKSPLELFGELYLRTNGREMSEEQRQLLLTLLDEEVAL